jgi:hypothetical protein
MSSQHDFSSEDEDFVTTTKPSLPALPLKAAKIKRKAGGTGKKVKNFATTETMLEFVDEVNDIQDEKINLLMDRDVSEFF